MDFKGLQFKLDANRLGKAISPTAKSRINILAPQYMQEKYLLNVKNYLPIFFVCIDAQEQSIGVGCHCEWCIEYAHEKDENKNRRYDKSVKDYYLKAVHDIANLKKGKCISVKYNLSELEFECMVGHRWKTSAMLVKRGHWCPDCVLIAKGVILKSIQAIANKREGKCLSVKYNNSNTKLEFECKEGHKWLALPAKIKAGTWCPKCSGNQKHTVEYMQQLAAKRGGVFLSTKYINNKTPQLWGCSEGHTWEATPDSIIHINSWCPRCNVFNSQERCRNIFEFLTGQIFIQTRKVIGVELDGYCKELNVAFEYQGKQHYEYVEFYHNNKEALRKQQIRDAEKVVMCKEKGIVFIEVPYTKSSDNVTLAKFIYDELSARNVPMIKVPDEIRFDEFKIATSKMEELHKIAQSKGGKLLSTVYISVKSALEWQCERGHIWLAIPDSIKRGNWCRKCAYLEVSRTVVDMHLLAAKKEGKFLSADYINSETKYEWQCKVGHKFETSAHLVSSGSWCPICAILLQRLTIEQMREFAMAKGGECLSIEYINIKTPLRWKCQRGHEWEAPPSTITRGCWCPECAKLNHGASVRKGWRKKKENQLALNN